MRMIKRFLQKHLAPVVYEFSNTREVPDPGRDVLETLAHHPGFLYLLWKLRLERAALVSKLSTESFSLREDDIFRAGIYWSGWLDKKLQALISMKRIQEISFPTKDELVEFNKLRDNLKEVGI